MLDLFWAEQQQDLAGLGAVVDVEDDPAGHRIVLVLDPASPLLSEGVIHEPAVRCDDEPRWSIGYVPTQPGERRLLELDHHRILRREGEDALDVVGEEDQVVAAEGGGRADVKRSK